jgi:putative DNA primase/helicase
VDTDGELMRMAKGAVRARLKNAVGIGDDDRRQREAKWAVQSESLPRLEAMVTLARSEKPLADSGGEWDTDALLLGVSNGLVDLRTGTLRPGTPGDRITLHSEITFDPQAKCPRWDRFLAEIFDGNRELISYVHRAVGYCLTSQTSEQCFFCWHGEGANGKSKFLGAIGYTLGSYTLNLPFSAFELTARGAISNDVAALPGRRFVTAIETDEFARLNEARIKALTGGDLITARQLYREFFSFKPVAKFWLAFNHPPIVADDSHGYWRRVRLISFVRQFDPQTEPSLEETLRIEAPGILAWAVDGCLEWQKNGLTPPAIVLEATQAYRDQSDPLRDFLGDRCILHENASVSAAVLWKAYLSWALQYNEGHSVNRSEFSRRLEARGLRKDRRGHARIWTWLGISLRGADETQNTAASEEIPVSTGSADGRADVDVTLQ